MYSRRNNNSSFLLRLHRTSRIEIEILFYRLTKFRFFIHLDGSYVYGANRMCDIHKYIDTIHVAHVNDIHSTNE